MSSLLQRYAAINHLRYNILQRFFNRYTNVVIIVTISSMFRFPSDNSAKSNAMMAKETTNFNRWDVTQLYVEDKIQASSSIWCSGIGYSSFNLRCSCKQLLCIRTTTTTIRC